MCGRGGGGGGGGGGCGEEVGLIRSEERTREGGGSLFQIINQLAYIHINEISLINVYIIC